MRALPRLKRLEAGGPTRGLPARGLRRGPADGDGFGTAPCRRDGRPRLGGRAPLRRLAGFPRRAGGESQAPLRGARALGCAELSAARTGGRARPVRLGAGPAVARRRGNPAASRLTPLPDQDLLGHRRQMDAVAREYLPDPEAPGPGDAMALEIVEHEIVVAAAAVEPDRVVEARTDERREVGGVGCSRLRRASGCD